MAILESLKNLDYPKQYRGNVGEAYTGFVLGLVNSWAGKGEKAGHKQLQSRRSEMKKYEKVHQEAIELMKEYDPNFVFTTIQFNKNKKMPKHIDGKNMGESYIIGLGDYKRGGLYVYEHGELADPVLYDIQNTFYKFNGSELYHETEDFTGDRYTLVFYKI